MVLASLLSESYLRFKGLLLPRFLFALSDPCQANRGITECVFLKILRPRHPQLLSQLFLDAVCCLCGWALPSHQAAIGNEAFWLTKHPGRRCMVYGFLLGNMTLEQKLGVAVQLVTVGLSAFTADEATWPQEDDAAGQALTDCLQLLSCKEMRGCLSPRPASLEKDEEAITRSKLKQLMREDICPVLVQLKHSMEEKRSPFLEHLRRCLVELLWDWRGREEETPDRMRELLGEPQVASELAFDLCEERHPANARRLPLEELMLARENRSAGSSQTDVTEPEVQHETEAQWIPTPQARAKVPPRSSPLGSAPSKKRRT